MQKAKQRGFSVIHHPALNSSLRSAIQQISSVDGFPIVAATGEERIIHHKQSRRRDRFTKNQNQQQTKQNQSQKKKTETESNVLLPLDIKSRSQERASLGSEPSWGTLLRGPAEVRLGILMGPPTLSKHNSQN